MSNWTLSDFEIRKEAWNYWLEFNKELKYIKS